MNTLIRAATIRVSPPVVVLTFALEAIIIMIVARSL